MDARAAARTWIQTWQRAWPAGDVDALAALYVEGTPYRSHPFRDAERARDYLSRAFGEEELVESWFGEPVVAGDRAGVEYWAVLREGDVETTIAGTSMLRFGDDGRVVEHRDYWDHTPGRREPPPGWGG